MMQSQKTLTTDRLVIRPFQMSDVPRVHTFFSDPVATRFWSDPHTKISDTESWVQGTIRADPAKARDFVLEREGQVIGKAGCWDAPEIGFFLLPAYQRQGYMREALHVILPHLFTDMGLDHVTTDVDPDNQPCLSLLRRLGFTETHRKAATIKINGVWCDSVYLRLNRSDWTSDRRTE